MLPTRSNPTAPLNNDPHPRDTQPNPSLMSQIQKSARSFCDAFALAWDRLPSIRKTSAKNIPLKSNIESKKYEDVSKVATKSMSKSRRSNEAGEHPISFKKNSVISKKGNNPSESPPKLKTSAQSIKNLRQSDKNKNAASSEPSSTYHLVNKMVKRVSESRSSESHQTSKTQKSHKIQTPIIVDDKAKYAVASKLVDQITERVKKSPTEGVFRLSGTQSTIQNIYSELMENPQSEIPEMQINDLTGILKEFLKNNRPITGEAREVYLEVGRLLAEDGSNESNTEEYIQKLNTTFKTLEPSQQQLLKEIISMCNTLLDENISAITLMKSDNLAIALGSSLFQLQTLSDPADSQMAFKFLLLHHDRIFS